MHTGRTSLPQYFPSISLVRHSKLWSVSRLVLIAQRSAQYFASILPSPPRCDRTVLVALQSEHETKMSQLIFLSVPRFNSCNKNSRKPVLPHRLTWLVCHATLPWLNPVRLEQQQVCTSKYKVNVNNYKQLSPNKYEDLERLLRSKYKN